MSFLVVVGEKSLNTYFITVLIKNKQKQTEIIRVIVKFS